MADPHALSDEEIVVRILRGEHRLFEIVMRRNTRRLHRLAWAILRNQAEAEDAVQETFVNAFIHLPAFEGRAKLSTWLARIAVNESTRRLRESRRYVQLVVTAAETNGDREETDTRETPESAVIANDLKRRLDSSIARLPETLRLVYVLRELEGLSTSETAEAVGITVSNVKVRLHRARACVGRDLSLAERSASSASDADPDRVARNVIERLRARTRQRAARAGCMS